MAGIRSGLQGKIRKGRQMKANYCVEKTADGWIIETTNMVSGMLEQGGIAGRRVLYTTATLRGIGIDPDGNPDDLWPGNSDCGLSQAAYLTHEISPDRILDNGHPIV